MDKKTFTEIEERLLEVNKVIEKLDSSIRVAAFDFLKPYILGGDIKAIGRPKSGDGSAHDTVTHDDLPSLVKEFGSDTKPSDNAKLLSAWWYSQYGTAAFSMSWIDETGRSTGLTVPSSPDMTFRQAAKKGKSLFKPLGKGELFQPTVVGEAYLKETYKVKKGTKTAPTETR